MVCSQLLPRARVHRFQELLILVPELDVDAIPQQIGHTCEPKRLVRLARRGGQARMPGDADL